MSKDSKGKTAFITSDGVYYFKRKRYKSRTKLLRRWVMIGILYKTLGVRGRVVNFIRLL